MTTRPVKRTLAIITVIVIVFLNHSCNENISTEFDTYQALNESNYLQNGWIPSILPRDATNIKEIHNIDNNRTYGCFDFLDKSIIDTLLSRYPTVSLPNLIKSLETVNLPKRPPWFITTNDLKIGKPIIIKYDDVIVNTDTSSTLIIFDTINLRGYFFR